MSFEGGVDVGAGLFVAGPIEAGGASDDHTQLRVLGHPLQTAAAVEITKVGWVVPSRWVVESAWPPGSTKAPRFCA